MGKKILVTGGAGYIGSFIVRELKQEGFVPFIVDNLYSGHRQAIKGFDFLKLDIYREKEKLRQLVKKEKFIGVIHLAALIEVAQSYQDPLIYYQNNLLATLNLLQTMVEFGLKNIVFSSTAAVYGEVKQVPIKEEDISIPINPYGETKLAAERMLNWFGKAYGGNNIIFRFFNAAGASLDGSIGDSHKNMSHIIPKALIAAIRSEEFKLFGTDYDTKDGTCVRDYIHVLDLASAHVLGIRRLIETGIGGIYNLGMGKGFTNLEIIREVEKVVGSKIKIKCEPRRPGDPPYLIASNIKIFKDLGWKPKYELQDIIKSAFLWHKTHPDGYLK